MLIIYTRLEASENYHYLRHRPLVEVENSLVANAMEALLDTDKQWFVLRDFKKWNAKVPGYKDLPERGIRCFTPMHWIVSLRKNVRRREYVPVIQNLLFAYDTRETLDPIIARTASLQYQFKRGSGSGVPMTVPDADMDRFIRAINNDPSPIYYTSDELTADMLGKEIIVNGGPLDGYRGKLLKLQGSKKKRLIVKLEGFVAAAVEVNPDFIQFV